jgi:hypothetical protein
MKKTLLYFFLLLFAIGLKAQNCTDLFISEYVEGTGNNKAIELFNPTSLPISLTGYKLVRYSNGGTTPYDVLLGGTISAKSTYVVVVDQRDPNGTGQDVAAALELQALADTFLCPDYNVNRMMYFNGNDAVTLEKTDGTVVDIFGQVGPPMVDADNGWGNLNDTTINYNSNGVPTSYTIHNYIVGPLFWLSWSMNQSLIRKATIRGGVQMNPDPYFVVYTEWDSIPTDVFDSLGSHFCECSYLNVNESKVSDLSIFPNPVTDNEFSVTANEPIGSIHIFDIAGKQIDNISFTERTFSYSYKTTQSLLGFYLVKVTFSSGLIETEKVLFK